MLTINQNEGSCWRFLYNRMLCDDADMLTIIIQVLFMQEFVKEIKIHMLMHTCWWINLYIIHMEEFDEG